MDATCNHRLVEHIAKAEKAKARWIARYGPIDKPDKPPPKPPALRKRAGMFLRAVSGPKATESEYQRRMAVCATCPYMREHDGGRYCTACGCGKWKLAELSTKLRYARLECPDRRW